MGATKGWKRLNQRRIALIEKSSCQTLTQSEADELQSLQEAADQHLAEHDNRLLAELERLNRAIAQLPTAD